MSDIPEMCPVCYPDESIAVVSYCTDHVPDRTGSEDQSVPPNKTIGSGTILEGGEDGKIWCDLIHRGSHA